MIIIPPRLPLAAAAGHELRALLAPVTPAAFVGEYWARKPLFVKGFATKFSGFFDAETFSRAIAPPGPFPPDFLRASFDRKTDAGTSAAARFADEYTSNVFRAEPEQAAALYSAGATLCVSRIEARVPALVPFLAAIKRQLGYPGQVCFNAYLSPPGSGFNWHFDSRIASTLQIEGSKTWRFTRRPAAIWPRGNGTLRADGRAIYTDPGLARAGDSLAPLDLADVDEVLLEPGDLLVIPAGTWHEACGGSGGSLALNLSFNPLSYTAIARQLLETLLGGDPAWRAAAPLLPGDLPGECDPAGIAAISAALADAAARLGALRGDSAAVVKLWQSLVANPDPGLPPPSAPAPILTPAVVPGARLRVRADADVYAVLAESGSRLCISIGAGRSIELCGAAVGFGQRILAVGRFVAAECTGWNPDGPPFAWPDVAALLTKLKTEGLIEDDIAAA